MSFNDFMKWDFFYFIFACVFLEGEDVTIDNGTFSWSAEGPPCLKRYAVQRRKSSHCIILDKNKSRFKGHSSSLLTGSTSMCHGVLLWL